MIFSANCNYSRNLIPANFLNNLSAKKMWVRMQESWNWERSRKEAPVYFFFSPFQLFSLRFLDLYESQTVFSWKSVSRFNYLKLTCHPPEADSTHGLCPLLSHGNLNKCGGTCRRCHTNFSLAVPPLSSHGGSSMECWSLITTVLRTLPGRFGLGRSVGYGRLLRVSLNLTPKGPV